jgi:ABC-type nickel/cobalt efflux system permease component RcnA
MGLAGGLLPSPSALLVLLGAVALGHPWFGVSLVVAFGLGMAVVLGGVGLLLVQASRLTERLPGVTASATLRRLWSGAQVLTAALVVSLGVVLTTQAIAQVL